MYIYIIHLYDILDMYVCMYVGTNIRMYVCMYVYTYVCMYVCMCVCVCYTDVVSYTDVQNIHKYLYIPRGNLRPEGLPVTSTLRPHTLAAQGLIH
jgi:hypothetical protein